MSDRPFQIKKELFLYVKMILKGRCRMKIEIRISQLTKVTLAASVAALTVIFFITWDYLSPNSSDKKQLIATMLFLVFDMLLL